MKKLPYILMLSLLMLSYACVENDPKIEDFPSEKVDFKYEVAGNEYKLDYLVGSVIQFTNTSSAKGNCVWEFGDGTVVSNEENPQYKYTVAGTYTVTLKVEGEGQRNYRLLINDIAPTVSISAMEDEICEVNKTFIELSVVLPNPDNKEVEYQWIFPEGTVDENQLL